MACGCCFGESREGPEARDCTIGVAKGSKGITRRRLTRVFRSCVSGTSQYATGHATGHMVTDTVRVGGAKVTRQDLLAVSDADSLTFGEVKFDGTPSIPTCLHREERVAALRVYIHMVST